ncbi:Hypothetical predicted protein [Cloeon dipterum]|uniref:CHCH domain-containing protein n=1 Tax=Cloeon dipterum TaxID=197152 RepID=A0A8S1DTU7_9INSE|nr:Hypothetical predicted protein [Cloeon dipterum]
MRIWPPLATFAQGYGRKVKARTPALEPIPFQERLPLKLKSQISTKKEGSEGASCLQEMAVLFTCLKSNEFNQTVCSKEISAFQKCFSDHKAKREEMKKDTTGIGSKKLTSKQVNVLLKKYSR